MSTCSISVGLYIKGDQLVPSELTRRFHVQPNRQQQKGEVSSTRHGKAVTRQTGLWALESTCESNKLSDHLNDLADSLARIVRSGALRKGQMGIEEAYVDIFVFADAMKTGDAVEFSLSTSELQLLSSLALPIKFTAGMAVPKHSE